MHCIKLRDAVARDRLCSLLDPVRPLYLAIGGSRRCCLFDVILALAALHQGCGALNQWLFNFGSGDTQLIDTMKYAESRRLSAYSDGEAEGWGPRAAENLQFVRLADRAECQEIEEAAAPEVGGALFQNVIAVR